VYIFKVHVLLLLLLTYVLYY